MTPQTVACQAPLSVGFPRQEHWSGEPFPFPGDLPDPRIELGSRVLQADSLLSEPPGECNSNSWWDKTPHSLGVNWTLKSKRIYKYKSILIPSRSREFWMAWLANGHQFSCSIMSDSLRPHESQHARPTCPSPTHRVYSNSCPSSPWCHPAISSSVPSVIPFSSCLQSFPASAFFPMSQLFAWGGLSIGVSALASVLPMNTQDWSPLGWTGWISLQSKGL